MTVEAEKGFNFEDYDLTFSKKGLKNYNKEFKNAMIEKKDNGKHYLPKGKYQVFIEGVSNEFEIK